MENGCTILVVLNFLVFLALSVTSPHYILFGLTFALFLLLIIIIIARVSEKSVLSHHPVKKDGAMEEYNLSNIEIEGSEITEEYLIKLLCKEFSFDIFEWEQKINSAQIKRSITVMRDLFSFVIKTSNETIAKSFFSRYAKDVNKLLEKYDQLEELEANDEDTRKTKIYLEDSFEQIAQAFKNEVNLKHKYDLQTINAESKAFLQSLRNRGLLD